MSKFLNKYRKETIRLQNWDYGWTGSYFVTILTERRTTFFGEIINDEVLSDIGKIVFDEWLKTLTIRPDMNLHLGEFVVMPDHFHAIITIGSNEFNEKTKSWTDAEVRQTKKMSPQKKNLSSIIRGFKASVTSKAREINTNFGWHERFYDHVIRSYEEYEIFSQYIKDNPRNWKKGKLKNIFGKNNP
jgi:putative transposase